MSASAETYPPAAGSDHESGRRPHAAGHGALVLYESRLHGVGAPLLDGIRGTDTKDQLRFNEL